MTVYEFDKTMPAVSNSEIQTWLDCRRRWFLTYYREMAPAARPLHGALNLGIDIHECLDQYYTNGTDPIETYETLYSRAVWYLLTREAETGFTDYEVRKKMQSERELAHAMLEGYIAWVQETGNDEGIEVTATETVVEVDSPVPGVRIRGKLDQRIYRKIDGARRFRDFKTAASLTQGPQLLPIDEQMKFYMLLELLDAVAKSGSEPPEPTMGGLYLMLKKVKRTATAKPPFYQEVEVHHNSLEIDSMLLRTQKRIEEMLSARNALDNGGDHRYEVYPHPTRDCTWKCPFFSICPMMDDSSDEVWESMLEQHFVPHDPYERYNDADSSIETR